MSPANALHPARESKAPSNPAALPPPPKLYVPPQHGLLAHIPTPWVPYAELMRLDRPAGLYAFYFPYLTGLSYSACVAQTRSPPPPPPSQLLWLSLLFLGGSVLLRGAACAWNDNIDQDFDRQVARCRNRPIARRAVSTRQGHVFTAALTAGGGCLLLLLPAPCLYHAVPITVLFAIYPFAKRFTNYPQVVLGFPFAWAIFMSCAALGLDPFGVELRASTGSLFMANVLWTVVYDTIYAHQDIKDDVKAGVKSMAVRFADSTKTLASVLAVFQVALLLATGWLANLSPVYFVLSCGGATVALVNMIVRVELSDPASCAWWFHAGFWLVGGSVVVGLVAEYATTAM